MTNLRELADRCEAATGPDRELDGAVLIAIGHAQRRGSFTFWMNAAGSTNELVGSGCPRYTASLDAAMTLVPEPHKWAITASSHDGGWQAWVWQIEGGPNWHEAATPALALTAAALRARDTDGRPEGTDAQRQDGEAATAGAEGIAQGSVS